jgi:hypothetical protein
MLGAPRAMRQRSDDQRRVGELIPDARGQVVDAQPPSPQRSFT